MSIEKPEDVIKNAMYANSKRMHTSMPATIVSFDPVTQLANVQPAIKTLLTNGESIELPPIIKVPISTLKSSQFCITLPVNQGDECLLVFCEKSLDKWKKDGAGFEAMHSRSHSLSDAIAFCSIYSQPNVIQNYDNENLCIRTLDSDISIKLNNDKSLQIKANNDTITLSNNNINIESSESIKLNVNNGSSIELPKSGKVKIKNEKDNEELISILIDTLEKIKEEPNLINLEDYDEYYEQLKKFQ